MAIQIQAIQNSPRQQNETFSNESKKRSMQCSIPIPQVEKSHNNLLICAQKEPIILKSLDLHSVRRIIQIHTNQTAND